MLVVLLFLLPTARYSFAALPTIMAMGDSITVGADYNTVTSGGYRDPLNRDLLAAGLPFTFVGINSSQATAALTSAGQQFHNGFGGWHVGDLDANLDGVAAPVGGGDSNNGGYILTGGHGTGRGAVNPDILLLHIGTNDMLQNTPNLNQALYSLVTHIHALSPNTLILVAGVVPINNAGLTARVNAYNSYIKTQLVPSLWYTAFVDQNTAFLNVDGSANASLLGTDDVHPNRFGYPIMAQNWATAIESVKSVTPATHTLTVQGGTGGGAYPPGSVVTLLANAPGANQQFANWTTATNALSNPYATPVVYTMPPADTLVTANYAVQGSPILPNGTYQILSNFNGLAVSATGTASASSLQQQAFSNAATQNWTLTNLGGNVVSLVLLGTSQALEVPPASVSTQGAPLDVEPYVGGPNQQWMLTPVAGTLEMVNQASGEVVNIAGYASAPGAPLLQFDAGYTDDWWVFYPTAPQSTLYALTVNQGSGGGMYVPGTAVTITAAAAPIGQQFADWSGGTSGLANASAPTTTLIMPAYADVLTATYTTPVATSTLTVSGGSGSGSYPVGTVVTVTANAAPAGSQFAGWTGTTTALNDPSAATTTVTMPSSPVTITAAYTSIAPPPAAPAASTSTVSVQFVGGGSSPLHGNGYDYTAGAPAYAAGNWNSLLNTGDTTTPQTVSVNSGLTDSTGASSPIGFQLQASGVYYTGAGTSFTAGPAYPGYPGRASGPGDAFLYAGFAYAGYSDGNPLTLTVVGLNPAHVYTMLAYLAPFEQFGGQQQASVSIGGAPTQVITDGLAGTYEQVLSGSAGTGNYAEFDGITGSPSQTLTLTNNGSMVGLSGFQVVDLGLASSSSAAPPATSVPTAGSPVTSAASSIVGIQLVGGGSAPLHGGSFDYMAGVYRAGHWNPILFTGNTSTPQRLTIPSGLTDAGGAATSIGLQLSTSGAYYTGAGTGFVGAPAYPGFPGQTAGSGDSFLFSGFGYAGYSNQAPLSLTLTGLKPADVYQLLIYIAPFEQFGDNQTATVALTGGPTLQVVPTGTASSYQRAGVPQGPASGNYVEFDGVTGAATQTVTLTNTSRLVGVSGIQLVDLGPR